MKRFVTSSIVLSVVVTVLMGSACLAGTIAENKTLVEEFVAIGNAREFDRLDAVVAVDFVRHCQATPGLDIGNLDQFKTFLREDAAVFPDSRVEILQIVAEKDRVAVWATYAGTQEGAMGPFTPSGRRMVLDFGAVFRIEEGRIAEMWVTWDNLAALTQLGHFPPPATE